MPCRFLCSPALMQPEEVGRTSQCGITLQRIVKSPFTHAIAMLLIYQSVLSLFALHSGTFGTYAGIALSLTAIFSSVVTLVGLQWRGGEVLGLGIQRVGLFMTCGVWLLDGVTLGFLGAFATLGTPLLLLLATGIRAFALKRKTKNRVDQLKEIKSALEAKDRVAR